jgi:quinol monooxygenase YgiN
MSDLRVVAEIVAQPGSEDHIRDALTTLSEATRQEPGCRSYELFESTATPGTFFTIETWADEAAMAGHLETPHIAAAFAAADGHVASAPSIHPLRPVG